MFLTSTNETEYQFIFLFHKNITAIIEYPINYFVYVISFNSHIILRTHSYYHYYYHHHLHFTDDETALKMLNESNLMKVRDIGFRLHSF